jgi:hypothetical protein
MAKRFMSKGMSKADATLVASKMAQYDSLFVSLMVSEELGLQLPDDNDAALIPKHQLTKNTDIFYNDLY